MNYQDIRMAREQAQREIELANEAARQAARLIAGRLRASDVQCRVLEELKKELRNYNMKTCTWKD